MYIQHVYHTLTYFSVIATHIVHLHCFAGGITKIYDAVKTLCDKPGPKSQHYLFAFTLLSHEYSAGCRKTYNYRIRETVFLCIPAKLALTSEQSWCG